MTQHFSRIVALSFVLTACGTESPSPQLQPSRGIVPPPPSSITVSHAASGAAVQHWVGKSTVLDPTGAFDWDYGIYSDGYTQASSSGFFATAITNLRVGTYPLYSAALRMGNTSWKLAPGSGSLTLEPYGKYSWPASTVEATFVDESGVVEPVIVRVTHGP